MCCLFAVLQLALDTRMFLCNASKVTDADYAQAQVSKTLERSIDLKSCYATGGM
jgi:hypothetical protein